MLLLFGDRRRMEIGVAPMERLSGFALRLIDGMRYVCEVRRIRGLLYMR